MRDDVRYFHGLCGVTVTTIWHTLHASSTTFLHVSLFTKDDDRPKMVPVRCCFCGHVFGLFVSLSPAVLIRYNHEANISLEAGYCQILFLGAVFVLFHSRYQSKLIPVPPFARPMSHQGLYLRTLFLGSKCWMLPRHIYPMGNLGPKEMRMLEGGVILDALL